MAKFLIQPHFRLHEWVAEEKGYFRDEGLDYEFREEVQSSEGKVHDRGDRQGAMQAFEAGRRADVSCACHWTVNVAAAKGHGRIYTDAYSVSPCGVFVPADSNVKTPEELAGVPISVGYQSGSHYATIQALEQFMPREQIELTFSDGMLFARMEKFLEGRSPACTLFSGPYYFAEQLGFRKVVDCTFMITAMIHGHPEPDDVRRYYRALQRAQRRPAARAVYSPLRERVPQALPRENGHAPLGTGRAHRLRAVLSSGVRGQPRLDPRARDLRGRRHRRRNLRRGRGQRRGAMMRSA